MSGKRPGPSASADPGREPRRFWVRVPGSTSNLGPGFDALGMAVDVFLEATWEASPETLKVTRSGTLESAAWPLEEELVLRGLRPSELTGRLHLHSDIPVGRGLGSSAAARVAGAVLRRLRTRGAAEREEVLQEAARGEGHPDNAAPAVLGGLVAATLGEDGEVVAVPLPVSPRIGWVYAAPGSVLATSEARAALPAEVPLQAAIRNAGRLSLLIPALATGDGPLLARAMEDELHVPYRLPLVPGAVEAVAAGKDAGAWAVTLSGAGSGLLAAVRPGTETLIGEAMAQSFRAHAEGTGGEWTVLRPWLPGARWGPGPLRPPGPERFATSRG